MIVTVCKSENLQERGGYYLKFWWFWKFIKQKFFKKEEATIQNLDDFKSLLRRICTCFERKQNTIPSDWGGYFLYDGLEESLCVQKEIMYHDGS